MNHVLPELRMGNLPCPFGEGSRAALVEAPKEHREQRGSSVGG